MRILFDMSGTIFGSLDLSPRPGIKETIEALRNSGNIVEFWTAGPINQYEALLTKAGISGNIYSKKNPELADVFVDDEPTQGLPGRVFKVSAHVSKLLQGNPISAEEILKAGGRPELELNSVRLSA